MRVWPDQTAVVNALLNGEIDAAALEPADVAAVEGTPGSLVAHYPSPRLHASTSSISILR